MHACTPLHPLLPHLHTRFFLSRRVRVQTNFTSSWVTPLSDQIAISGGIMAAELSKVLNLGPTKQGIENALYAGQPVFGVYDEVSMDGWMGSSPLAHAHAWCTCAAGGKGSGACTHTQAHVAGSMHPCCGQPAALQFLHARRAGGSIKKRARAAGWLNEWLHARRRVGTAPSHSATAATSTTRASTPSCAAA